MAADPLVGKVLADRFEILERIGEGGTGVVYKAKQITVDREIAIKVLGAHVSSDPQWVKRFHNEARAAAKLDHPNTIRLIEKDQVALLFDYVGTPTVTRCLPLLKRYNERSMCMFFPFTGAEPQRQPPYGDYVFRPAWDIMSDMTKARMFGFHRTVGTEAEFFRFIDLFRANRILP